MVGVVGGCTRTPRRVTAGWTTAYRCGVLGNVKGMGAGVGSRRWVRAVEDTNLRDA